MQTKEQKIIQALNKLSFSDLKSLLKEKGLWKFMYNAASEQQLRDGIFNEAKKYSENEVDNFIKNL